MVKYVETKPTQDISENINKSKLEYLDNFFVIGVLGLSVIWYFIFVYYYDKFMFVGQFYI